MKHLLLLTLCFMVVCGYDLEKDWPKFKRKYGKTYKDTSTEGKQRKKNFEENLKLIEEHNRKYEIENKKSKPKLTYKLSLTHLSDLSYAEFSRFYASSNKMLRFETKCNKKKERKLLRTGPVIGRHRPLRGKGALPKEVDWREKIQLSPIQNQGRCGCCWAFASVGAVEAHITIQKRVTEKLSEQELVDCFKTENTDGCDGGLHFEGFDYMIKKGITPAMHYRNKDILKAYDCNKSQMKDKKKIFGYRYILPTEPDEDEMKSIIAFIGPIATCMSTPKSVMNYGKNSGVFNDPSCNDIDPTHYVLIVGYGEDPKGGPYWLIKNSWSKAWGDDGYMKLARNKGNLCHVASEVFYPLV